MDIFKSDTFTDLWYDVITTIYESPDAYVNPRGTKTKANIADIMCLINPRNRIAYIPKRKYSLIYAIGESLWYLTGKNDLKFIEKFAPSIGKYSNDGETLNSGYGDRIFESLGDGVTQFNYVIEKILNDKQTRQAVIHIRESKDSAEDVRLGFKSKDIPCTLTLHFQIVEDKLILICNMRSQDAMTGMLYDFFTFTFLQEFLYTRLKKQYKKLRLGEFILFCSNEHIYDNWNERTKKIIKNRNWSYVEPMSKMSNITDYQLEFLLTAVKDLIFNKRITLFLKGFPKYWFDIYKLLCWHFLKEDNTRDEFIDGIDKCYLKSLKIFRDDCDEK